MREIKDGKTGNRMMERYARRQTSERKKRKTKEEEQVHFSGKGIEGSGAHVRRIQDYA